MIVARRDGSVEQWLKMYGGSKEGNLRAAPVEVVRLTTEMPPRAATSGEECNEPLNLCLHRSGAQLGTLACMGSPDYAPHSGTANLQIGDGWPCKQSSLKPQ